MSKSQTTFYNKIYGYEFSISLKAERKQQKKLMKRYQHIDSRNAVNNKKRKKYKKNYIMDTPYSFCCTNEKSTYLTQSEKKKHYHQRNDDMTDMPG